MKARKISLDQIRDAARIQRELVSERFLDGDYQGPDGAKALDADLGILWKLETDLQEAK